MRFEEIDARIRAAVDGVAASDPNPTDPFRGLYISDQAACSLARAAPIEDLDARVASVAAALGLSALETEVLAMCAAPELSPRYGRLLAYLHDDVTRKLASPRLVTRLLADDRRRLEDVLACFARDAPLLALGAIRLLDGEAPVPLADRLIKVPDRLAAELLGVRIDAPQDEGRLRRLDVDAVSPLWPRPTALEALRSQVIVDSRVPLLVVGPDAALLLAHAIGQGLLLLDLAAVLSSDALADAALAARLEGRRLCLESLEHLSGPQAEQAGAALSALQERPLLCAATRDGALKLGGQTVMIVETSMPSFAERREIWRSLAGTEDVGAVAGKFRLSGEQIAKASAIARLAAAARGTLVSSEDLHVAARQASTTSLGELAIRVTSAFTWDDLVLPARQLELLRSISAYLRHRDLVLSEWGYERAVARNQGLKVLFAGESGTGKTMAAQVLANGLGLELFRIDLATVVSKYIGETEKNLDHIFMAAEGSNAILFFDEADALFGKRSEVSDAHDRYANIEVAYLLQKMESYSGAVVLATNFRRNVDEAFLRRLDFVIDFPFPEPRDRIRIWRLLLPDSAPLADDLDLEFLANQFKLSGGAIRNCSLAAAFLAADDGGVITMDHLVRAVAIEYGKLGRLTLEADFERFYEAVRAEARAEARSGTPPARLSSPSAASSAAGTPRARA
jgi:hypothetical protein